MFPIQDQISVATKNSLEANLALYASLTNKTFESVEKLINLNISTVKASIEESSAATRTMLAARDPQEFFSMVAEHSKPKLDTAITYGSRLAGIASSAQAEFTKAAELQMAAISSKVHELVEEAARKAPAGSESLVAVVKSTMGNANNGYEQLSRTAKQAMEAMEANLNVAVSQFAQAAGQNAAKA